MTQARKILVLNYSGNVGKTTWAKSILLPRLHAQLFNVETVNDTDSNDPKIRARQFAQLMEAISVLDNAVVDVGASCVEQFLNEMEDYVGSHDDFDYYVVPCTEPLKQQRDTVATIEALARLGVPPSKIRVGFNNVERDTVIEQTFNGLFEYQRTHKKFQIYPEAVVRSTDLFAKLRTAGLGMREVLADERDFKQLQSKAASREEKLQWTMKLNLQRLAIGVDRQLDHVFDTILGEP